jgi:hypothetical protein
MTADSQVFFLVVAKNPERRMEIERLPQEYVGSNLHVLD